MTGPTSGKSTGPPRPGDVARYLDHTDWQPGDRAGQALVWNRELPSGLVQVLVPTSADLGDYETRINDVIRTLALVEERTAEAIRHELLNPFTDIQLIRTRSSGPSGTISLERGHRAVQGVRDLFLSAATGAYLGVNPAVLPSSRPVEARRFLEVARFGPTGAGSFVWRVETEIGAPQDVSQLNPRTVLLALYRSSSAAYSAAEEYIDTGDLVSFEEHVPDGVTANLCDALVTIGNSGAGFDLSFTWSWSLPVSEPTPDLAFRPIHIMAVKEAAKHLRSLDPQVTATFHGRVIELLRRSRSAIGTAVVEGVFSDFASVAGQRIRVALHLSDELYQRALEAHRSQAVVTVRGSVQVSPRSYRMMDLTSFDVEPDTGE